jgi:hypothetical protein
MGFKIDQAEKRMSNYEAFLDFCTWVVISIAWVEFSSFSGVFCTRIVIGVIQRPVLKTCQLKVCR